MPPIILTKPQAKKIILHAAGLSKHAQFGKGKEAAYKLIDHSWEFGKGIRKE